MFPGKIVPKLFIYLFLYLFMWTTSFDNNLNWYITIFLIVAGQCGLVLGQAKLINDTPFLQMVK